MADISINRITKGVVSDTHPAYQPEGTLRESMNGELIHNSDGYYVWKPIHGNELYIDLEVEGTTTYHLGWVMMRNNLVIILNDSTNSIVKIYTVDTETNIAPVGVLVTQYSHATWGTRNKIKSIVSFYENEDKQWIIFSDNVNPPRIINIADPSSSLSIDMTPLQDTQMQIDTIEDYTSVGTGTLKSGTYYICWRGKNNDGYVSPWSNLNGPFVVGSHIGTPAGNYDTYQGIEADYHGANSGKSISLFMEGDMDFHIIEIAYLYYSEYGVFDSGMIFYKEEAPANPWLYFTLQSNTGYETITIDDILLNYITILKAKEIEIVENRCVVANIEESSELDVEDEMACDVSAITYEFPLDYTVPSPTDDTLSMSKALTGLKPLTDTLIDVYGYAGITPIYPLPASGEQVFLCAEGAVVNGDIIKFTGDGTVGSEFNTIIHGVYMVVQADTYGLSYGTFFNLVNPGDYEPGSFAVDSTTWLVDDPALKICKLPCSILPYITYKVTGIGISYWDGTEALNSPTYANNGDIIKITSGTGGIIHNSVAGAAQPTIHLSKYYDYSLATNIYKDINIYGYLNYKGLEMCKYLRGYGRKEKVRLALIGIDHYGKIKYARYLRDNTTGGDFTMPTDQTSPIVHGSEWWTYINEDGSDSGIIYPHVIGSALGIEINNLDITDIIDDISAFMIVRAPIISRYAARGILEYMNNHNAGTEIRRYHGFIGLANDLNRQPKNYVFISPDHLFNNPEFEVAPGAKLENIRYYTCERAEDSKHISTGLNTYEGIGTEESTYHAIGTDLYTGLYQKYRIAASAPTNTNGVIGKTNEIILSRDLEVMMESFNGDPNSPTKLVVNESTPWPDASSRMYGSRGLYIVTDDDEGSRTTISGAPNPIGHFQLSDSEPTILYCGILKNETVEYGSIYESGYVDMGHFQVVDAAFKAQILTGGHYIVDKLQLFGGDTYIGIFDVMRLYADYGTSYGSNTDHYCHSIIFPCESKINFELRKGNHVAKDRSYHNTLNTAGLKIDLSVAGTYGGTKLEEFFVNTGYSVTETEVKYPQLPVDFNNIYKFDVRGRWSERKVLNEVVNSFRNFPVLNYKDFNTSSGEIKNIRYNKNRLFIWQPEMFSYSPYQERELTQNALGVPIQIGIGGEFDRIDEIMRRIGNSHQEGLVDVDNGYIWCDYLRKELFYFDLNNGLQNMSVMLGFDKLLKEELEGLQFGYDSAKSAGQGICGGYDPVTKIAYITIWVYDEILGAYPTTIAINMEHNIFMGKVSLDACEHINTGKKLLMTNINETGSTAMYKISDSVYTFWGNDEFAYMILVVNKDVEIPKGFDNIEIETGSNSIDTITYSNEVDSVSAGIANQTTGVIDDDNYEYINGVLKGNIPLITETTGLKSRMQHKGYLLIKLSVDTQRTDRDIYVRSLKTKYRQIY